MVPIRSNLGKLDRKNNLFVLWGLLLLWGVPLGFAQEMGLLERARQLRGEKNFSEAIAVYEEAVIKDPENIDVLIELAQTYAWSRNDQKALEVYDRVLSDMPDHTDALLGKASVLSWRQEYARAEPLFQKVIDLAPDYIDAYLGLARMWGWQGHYNKADRVLTKALEQNPESEQTLRVRAQVLTWAGRSTKAIPIYRKLVDIHPKDVALLLSLARAQREASKVSQAIKTFQKAQSLAPQRHDIQAELGQAYAHQLRLDDAITELEKIVNLQSASIDDYVTLGRVYAYKNRLSDSMKLYRKALEVDPKNLDARNGLARAQGYARQWQVSKETFLKVIEQDPFNVEAKEGLERIRKLSSPFFTTRFDFFQAKDNDPMSTTRSKSTLAGSDSEIVYPFNPDQAIFLRGGHFVIQDTDRVDNVTKIRANRSEFGLGGHSRLPGSLSLRGRFDLVRFSDGGDAQLGRDQHVFKGAGFALLEWELERSVWNALFSEETFLLEADSGGHWDPVETHSYSVSGDVDWTDQASTLLQIGGDIFPYIPNERLSVLGRARYRPSSIPALLLEAQSHFLNKPDVWNHAGFVNWTGEWHPARLGYELEYSLARDTSVDKWGHLGKAVLSWKILKDFKFYEEVSYRSNYDFRGTVFVNRTYVGYVF